MSEGFVSSMTGYVAPQTGTAIQPPRSHVCPGCGRCSCCDRGGQRAYPWVNPYPWYGQPWWGVAPPNVYPGYVGGTITVSNTSEIESSVMAGPAWNSQVSLSV